MTHIECPIKNCEGYSTSSSRGNVVNHLKEMAKSELLAKYILGKGDTSHAEYLKAHTKTETVNVYRVGKITFTLQGKQYE
jgi:hypothetical protein